MAEPARIVGKASFRSAARILAELTKVRITVVVTLTVATGFIVFAKTVNAEIILPLLGTFLLACGSATLNQVQEAPLDAQMARTRRRPIPSGQITREWAAVVALALIGIGLTTLASIERHTWTLVALGITAVVWYNGIYVVLKRWTPFAVVPGSLIGAIPPVIGWVAAGGLLTDPAALNLGMFFFLWQIPHFWLLLMLYGKQYAAAGFPSLTKTFSAPQLARITCVWILAVATWGVLMGATGGGHLPWNAVIVASSLWLAANAFGLLRVKRLEQLAIPAFIRINVYLLLIMAALVGNAFF